MPAAACDGAGTQSPAATIPSDEPAVTPPATPNLEATVAAMVATAMPAPTATAAPTLTPAPATATPNLAATVAAMLSLPLPPPTPTALPTPTPTPSPTPTPVAQLPAAPGYSAVTAGGKHTCRLDADGIATYWGANGDADKG